MTRLLLSLVCLLIVTSVDAQKPTYVQSLNTYQKKYVAEHEVVEGKDKKFFRFYPIDIKYKVTCSFEKITDTVGFIMKASGDAEQHYYKYGRITFKLNDTTYSLFVYQSEQLRYSSKYRDHLFLPFTDLTTGFDSYGGGRYIDLSKQDIIDNTVIIDFNKAYNPYCAYTEGYQCPIPPRENYLSTEIKAGEKTFAKPMH